MVPGLSTTHPKRGRPSSPRADKKPVAKPPLPKSHALLSMALITPLPTDPEPTLGVCKNRLIVSLALHSNVRGSAMSEAQLDSYLTPQHSLFMLMKCTV